MGERDAAGTKRGPSSRRDNSRSTPRRERARWSMIAAVVVIGSCRAGALSSAPQRRPPSAPESVEPSGTHPSASPVEPEYQPPEPMVWTDVPLPYSPDTVVVQPVEDRYQVVLFPDEAAAVRRSVAKELRRLGYEVVPIPELERIESAAAQGRLTLEDERECQVPLTPSEVRARYFDSFPQAHVYAECTVMPDSQATDAPECRLSVLVGRDGVFPQFVSAPIRDVHDPEAWTRASLRREGESVPGGVPWGIEGTPAVDLVVSRVIEVGPWKRSPGGRTTDALSEGGSRCLHPDPRMSLHWQVSAAIDQRGAVERCAARSSGLGARAEDGDCLCQQLEAVNLGRGRAGRRLRATAWDPGLTSIRWRRLEPIQPGTRAWIRRISESPEVLACMHGAHEKQGRWSGTAVLELSPAGVVDAVEMFGGVSTPAKMADVVECLRGALSSVLLPCRPPGIEALQVAVELGSIND